MSRPAAVDTLANRLYSRIDELEAERQRLRELLCASVRHLEFSPFPSDQKLAASILEALESPGGKGR